LKRMNVMPLTTHRSRRVHNSLRMMYAPMWSLRWMLRPPGSARGPSRVP
jgi:hypothetical protein